jgi:hypothetical protein
VTLSRKTPAISPVRGDSAGTALMITARIEAYMKAAGTRGLDLIFTDVHTPGDGRLRGHRNDSHVRTTALAAALLHRRHDRQ